MNSIPLDLNGPVPVEGPPKGLEADGQLEPSSLGIDPRKLMYFATVVELGSFKKAARALGVCQPALSTSMNRLESELGRKLLVRGSWGVAPTQSGEVLYSHSRMIRDELQLAQRNLLEAALGPDGVPMRFGCLPSLASNVVPTAISRWRKDHGTRDLRVIEAVQFDLLNGLLRRELDLFVGFTENYQLLEGLRQRVLFRDCLSIIARPGHPLFQEQRIELASLAGYPWVFLPSGPFNMGFEDELAHAGIRLMGGKHGQRLHRYDEDARQSGRPFGADALPRHRK